MSQAAALQNFVQLWVYLSATPLFGLTATVSVYVLAQMMSQRLDHAPWANPVLWTVLVLSLFLTVSGTAYPTYFSGAQFIHFLLGPAVVAGLHGDTDLGDLLDGDVRPVVDPRVLQAACLTWLDADVEGPLGGSWDGSGLVRA